MIDGEAGDAGESEARDRRLAGGRAEGGPGDSQKNEPKPGEIERDDGAGEPRREGKGESMSMPSASAVIGLMGSVYVHDQPLHS